MTDQRRDAFEQAVNEIVRDAYAAQAREAREMCFANLAGLGLGLFTWFALVPSREMWTWPALVLIVGVQGMGVWCWWRRARKCAQRLEDAG